VTQSYRQQFLLNGGVPPCVVSDRHVGRRDRCEGKKAYIACDRNVRVRLVLRWSGRRALITHSSSSQLVCGAAASGALSSELGAENQRSRVVWSGCGVAYETMRIRNVPGERGAIVSLTLTLLWIRTQNPSKRAAADLLLRPRSHWDQQLNLVHSGNMYI